MSASPCRHDLVHPFSLFCYQGNSKSKVSDTVKLFRDYAQQAKSDAALASYLSMLPRSPRYAFFRQLVVYCRDDLADYIQSRFSNEQIRIQRLNEQTSVFNLELKVGSKEKKTIEGLLAILPGKEPILKRLVTVSYGDFWDIIIRRLARRLYPGAMPVFFKQNEIRDAFLSFQDSLADKYRLRVIEVTMKRRLDADKKIKEKKFETKRLWTELTVQDAFDQALEDNYWFTGLGFRIDLRNRRQNMYKPVARGRVYKNGEIYYNALHDQVDEELIGQLEFKAAKRIRFLSHRGIIERNYEPSPPIEINYDFGIFNEKSMVGHFGNVISQYPHSTKAVFHSNPYYHASIADYLDGSSFEIWVLSPNRIVIVPQARCTEQSLDRLVSYIFVKFHEGDLDEYKE